MRAVLILTCLLGPAAELFADDPRLTPLVAGLKNASAVAVGPDGKVYLAVTGEVGKDGDGEVLLIDKDRALPWAAGLDDPCGLAVHQQWVFVADRQRIWRIDPKGKAEVLTGAAAFPTPPRSLQDLTVDPESGTLYVSDAGDGQGKGGAVYRVPLKGKASRVIDAARLPGLHTPSGLVLDGASHLLLIDSGTGSLQRVRLADGSAEKVADGFRGDGLSWDRHGRLFGSDVKAGRVLAIARPGDRPEALRAMPGLTDLCFDPTGTRLLVLDARAGTLAALPAAIPGAAVDETPLSLTTALAFPDVQWTGWKPETAGGKVAPFRPIVLTHAGDGSNRTFVATQHGVIHVLPADGAGRTQVFLDIQDRVSYLDSQNEEGFLGLAFHPRFKKNGEFFVFYTLRKPKLVNVVSRFRVHKDDPSRADPASEEELLRFTKPFWNHDGGTIAFGPDGMLYITHGDGGAANDPFDNGQNLKSLLGKVLRIDVDRKEDGKNYAVPPDNPLGGKADVRPEIWAYGLRNVWRMAFDRKTGRLWAGDVGQNLYEEINLIARGGNYGWNRREGLHPFGGRGVGPRADLIDPIWEYHHDIGKSITGGGVYRGTRLPELEGSYLYADYVTGKIWALRYDEERRRVTANRPIADRRLPILSFGEDEKGEMYLLTYSPTGQGIYELVRSAPNKH